MLRKRLLFGFVLVALLPALGVGIGTYLVSYRDGWQQSIERLESVAARKELAIGGWVQALQQELLFASQADYSPRFINNALRLANEDKRYAWYYNLVRWRLQGFVDQSARLEELFLLDLQGEVAVSTDPAREGRRFEDQPLFRRGLVRTYTQLPFDPDTGSLGLSDPQDPGLTVVMAVTPIFGDDGKLIGVMAGRAAVDALQAALLEGTGLGSTGRAYLVDSQPALLAGTGLSGGQRPPGEGRSASVNSRGITTAIQQQANVSGQYRDALGNSVIGVYRWLPDLQSVLSVEQASSEAFRTVSATIALNLAIALAAIVIAVTASLWMGRRIADPIADLADTATWIAKGDLERIAAVVHADEVGDLARAFNSMTTQLRDLINSLEQRVEQRTWDLQRANEALEQRAIQLETSAKVGREITSLVSLDVLLTRVVELIQVAFDYYHVQVFLLDRQANQLVLRASSGNSAQSHPPLDLSTRSINSLVVQTGRAIMSNNVLQDANFLFDHYLPETRSELVVPLRRGEQIIGTLDVQDSNVNSFAEEDILVIQGLGDQIVIAIENAQLYHQSRELAILEERTRLARELHDSVTQYLYSLVLLTEGWRRSLQTKGAGQTEEYLSRIGEISQQALKEMRLLIHELRPPALEKEGLIGALRKRLDVVEKHVGIEARVVMEDFVELPAPVEEGLYRIAQEALNNALKHAGARRETVRICAEAGAVILEVSDDGRGFDQQVLKDGGGMGLASMRERAVKLGGVLAIRSAPGEGTTVIVRLPLSTAG